MKKEPAPKCLEECIHYKLNKVIYFACICTERLGCLRKKMVEKDKKDE